MKSLILNFIFKKTKFSEIVSNLSQPELVDYLEKSISNDNYELSAYLKYYLDFKYKKSECNLTNDIIDIQN